MVHPIKLRELGDGDFEVVRGGDVCRRSSAGVVSDTIRKGERASAAEVCEWLELGAQVQCAS